MELINKETALKGMQLFSTLSPEELKLVSERSEIVEYKKGQIVYEEGSAPSAFYCVLSGRVEIFTRDFSGEKKILEYLHRGKYFGIISLLTEEPHSVTAQALNDCLMLVIRKEDFDFIIRKIASISIDLSQTLSRRLKRKDVHQKSIFESTIISVFSSYSQAGKTVYSLNLGLSLKKETHKSVVILDILTSDKTHSLPRRLGVQGARVFDLSGSSAEKPEAAREHIARTPFGVDIICFHYLEGDDSCVRKLLGIVSLLVNDYHYLVLDLPSFMDRCIFSILNQSDEIHLLTSPDEVDLKRTRSLNQRLRDEFDFRQEKIKVIINEYRLSKMSHEEQVAFLDRPVFATLPKIEFEASDRIILDRPDCEYAKAVRRIARQIGESQVGLVLGVGAAYGFCHIGVLKVIEQERIPIDIIAGASIGGLIAALWATGKSSHEILEITREFREPKNIWALIDLTIPRMGFIKGSKLRSFLTRHIGNKTFYDVRLPLKIIASDVRRREARVFERGPLVDAIMASCAMPGVFAPFRMKEEMLFDGGIINPLPTEPLIKMGVKKIIAVNVTPSREDFLRQLDKMKEEISPAAKEKKRRWFDIGGYFKTNVLDFIFSSVEILQSEVAQKEARLADVVLHPDTSGLFWLEFHRAKEFMRRGEEETRRNLDKIWQVIRE